MATPVASQVPTAKEFYDFQALLNSNLLEVVKKLLVSQTDTNIRMDCCELLQTLASNRNVAMSLISTGTVDVIIHMIEADKSLRWKFIKIVKELSKGAPQIVEYANAIARIIPIFCLIVSQYIRYLVQKRVISVLCRALSHFKEYDRVLTDVYKFAGPTYNFDIVNDVLTTLEFILNIGEIEVDERTGANRYAFHFDLECIDKIR